MATQYTALPLHTLAGRTGYFHPHQELPARVSHDSPAVLVMTDFRQITAVTVEPGVSMEWATRLMKAQGVRLLLVINQTSEVLGLITSNDVQGEKPMRLIDEYARRHEEITVRDVMTPHDQLEVLLMDDVLKASVGDVVATLRGVGRHHALVLDDDPRIHQPSIRGIFSISQIGKQLGEPVDDMVEVAHTFTEMGVALNT